VAYYFDVALWSSQFHPRYRAAFGALARVGFGTAAGIAGALALLIAAVCRLLPGRERRLRSSAAFCTVSMGFAAIGLEILLLLGFQAAYGYVYSYLALLIAAFMAGMAAGTYLGLRETTPLRSWLRSEPRASASGGWDAALSLAAVQILTALVCVIAGMATSSAALFPALAFVAGSLCGFEFPVAARVFGGRAGTLYALDLAGSCLGALLFSIYLVPVFGFLRTGLLMALVSLVAGLTAMLSYLEDRRWFSFLRRPAR